MSSHDNRRNYFRVDDKVYLHVKQLDKSDPTAVEQSHEAYRKLVSVNSELCQQRMDMEPELKKILSRNKPVAEYLALLGAQIEVLSSNVLGAPLFASNEPLVDINLSATGMRFKRTMRVEAGDLLEIVFVLFPEKTYITTVCDVVRVVSDSEDSEKNISVTFTHIDAGDVEILFRHVNYVQRQQLQRNCH